MKTKIVVCLIQTIIILSLVFSGIAFAVPDWKERGDNPPGKSINKETKELKRKGPGAKDKAETGKGEKGKENRDKAKIDRENKGKPVKEKVVDKRGRGTEAKELKQENRSKENYGRLNAIKVITNLLNDTSRKFLGGLQNALESIGKWSGLGGDEDSDGGDEDTGDDGGENNVDEDIDDGGEDIGEEDISDETNLN